MTLLSNTTRGVAFDPHAARLAREKKAEEINRLGLHARAELPESPRKQHALYLDQVNAAWRERARDRR